MIGKLENLLITGSFLSIICFVLLFTLSFFEEMIRGLELLCAYFTNCLWTFTWQSSIGGDHSLKVSKSGSCIQFRRRLSYVFWCRWTRDRDISHRYVIIHISHISQSLFRNVIFLVTLLNVEYSNTCHGCIGSYF